ncbi:MAG TPA: hypothetical protein VG738_14775 [Chitinophagaceae bacterium]|nr:hypothetical protein [Chitinophagaceae bacterium]
MQHQQTPGYIEKDVVDFNGLFTKPVKGLNILVNLAAILKKLKPGRMSHNAACKA